MVPTIPDAGADGSSRAAVEVDVLAAHAAGTDAIVTNDAALMGDFVTEDWVMVSESGVSAGEVQIRILGETALLTSRTTNTAHFQGRRYDSDEWTTDVFVRREGRWLCALTHYTAAAASPADA